MYVCMYLGVEEFVFDSIVKPLWICLCRKKTT